MNTKKMRLKYVLLVVGSGFSAFAMGAGAPGHTLSGVVAGVRDAFLNPGGSVVPPSDQTPVATVPADATSVTSVVPVRPLPGSPEYMQQVKQHFADVRSGTTPRFVPNPNQTEGSVFKNWVGGRSTATQQEAQDARLLKLRGQIDEANAYYKENRPVTSRVRIAPRRSFVRPDTTPPSVVTTVEGFNPNVLKLPGAKPEGKPRRSSDPEYQAAVDKFKNRLRAKNKVEIVPAATPTASAAAEGRFSWLPRFLRPSDSKAPLAPAAPSADAPPALEASSAVIPPVPAAPPVDASSALEGSSAVIPPVPAASPADAPPVPTATPADGPPVSTGTPTNESMAPVVREQVTLVPGGSKWPVSVSSRNLGLGALGVTAAGVGLYGLHRMRVARNKQAQELSKQEETNKKLHKKMTSLSGQVAALLFHFREGKMPDRGDTGSIAIIKSTLATALDAIIKGEEVNLMKN